MNPPSPQPPDDAWDQAMRELTDEFGDSGIDFVVAHPAPDTTPEYARGWGEQAVSMPARELSDEIFRRLATTGPFGWEHMDALFALTSTVGACRVAFTTGESVVETRVPCEVFELVRRHRELSSWLPIGPWWQLKLALDSETGIGQVAYDYGAEPFPEAHVFDRDVYLADLDRYPRERLPVWLAAHVFGDDRQLRPPRQAATEARADRAANVSGVVSERDFPAFPTMWTHWSLLAAAFVAAGSRWGPRVLPALGIFEGSSHSGSTLYVLPGDRAILSGGVWESPELAGAYHGDREMPKLYAGAPDWVTDKVLNPRAATSTLSFCYWWTNGRWYRGESPPADELAKAVPGVWTADTVIDVISDSVLRDGSAPTKAATRALLASADARTVTREELAALFHHPDFDVDSGFHQLSLAGLVDLTPPPPTDVEQLPADEAIARVRRSILDRGLDTSGYPLDKLVADRFSVGWMVFVPTEPGEIAIGRAIFYIGDDGVIEHATSSIAPSVYVEGFERRFRTRHNP